MCRIAGIVDRSSEQSHVEAKVKEMCLLQQHGGPDDEGIYSDADAKLVFGHRRLALLDLSPAGHQPMIYEYRYVISFNGEIYNFPALKKELSALGMRFDTHSDTEVILAAFSKWGSHSFAKLKGMFAFALFDKKENLLYLVRDPSGIKPLYYTVTAHSLEFASEVKALKIASKKEANPYWHIYQLAYGHIPEPVTTLKNVQPLPKGCFIKYDIGTEKIDLQSFAHYSFNSTIYSEAEAINGIQTNIKAAVERHLLSDAATGVFLSGGIDSSIVSILASHFKKEQLQTLSLHFKETGFSEKPYQDLLIEKLACHHYQHLLGEEEFEKSLPLFMSDMDMPSCDGINTWFISKVAKAQGLKAVLSGVGGDELFGGYPSFKRMATAAALQQYGKGVVNIAKNAGNKALQRLPYLQLEGVKGLYLFLRGQFTPTSIVKQLGCEEKEVWNVLNDQPILPDISILDHKNQASWMELNMYMQNQLLRDADVMSMAHGVEIRVPFLDDAVVKTALAIDPKIKYAGELPKQILINAFKNELPEPIWNRKKMGFTFPFNDWMKKSDYVKDIMESADKNSKKSYQEFLNNKLHWSHLMSLLILNRRAA